MIKVFTMLYCSLWKLLKSQVDYYLNSPDLILVYGFYWRATGLHISRRWGYQDILQLWNEEGYHHAFWRHRQSLSYQPHQLIRWLEIQRLQTLCKHLPECHFWCTIILFLSFFLTAFIACSLFKTFGFCVENGFWFLHCSSLADQWNWDEIHFSWLMNSFFFIPAMTIT